MGRVLEGQLGIALQHCWSSNNASKTKGAVENHSSASSSNKQKIILAAVGWARALQWQPKKQWLPRQQGEHSQANHSSHSNSQSRRPRPCQKERLDQNCYFFGLAFPFFGGSQATTQMCQFGQASLGSFDTYTMLLSPMDMWSVLQHHPSPFYFIFHMRLGWKREWLTQGQPTKCHAKIWIQTQTSQISVQSFNPYSRSPRKRGRAGQRGGDSNAMPQDETLDGIREFWCKRERDELEFEPKALRFLLLTTDIRESGHLEETEVLTGMLTHELLLSRTACAT